jgi:hypothetical protein
MDIENMYKHEVERRRNAENETEQRNHKLFFVTKIFKLKPDSEWNKMRKTSLN